MEAQLRDIIDAENRVGEALPAFILMASDQRLKWIIDEYQKKNNSHITRLRQVFRALKQKDTGVKCKAIHSMLLTSNDLIERTENPTVKDAVVITGLQHIIHYQVAGYGAITNYANTLDLNEVALLTYKNLDEKKATDRKLAELADEVINIKAKNLKS